MILDNYSSEELLHETYRDWKEEVDKIVKKKREEVKKGLPRKRPVTDWIMLEGWHTTKRGNRWYYSNGLSGDPGRPKSWNYMHISARGSKNRWILLRGIRSARESKSGCGYLVVVGSHVIQRIRERAGLTGTTEDILKSIFGYREIGLYYEYPWKVTENKALPVTIPDETEGLWWNSKKESSWTQVILKTGLGVFLGHVSQDKGVVELKTFVTELLEEQKDLVENFLVPAWKCYNGDRGELPKLQEYMKDKEDRKVYLLGD